MTIPKIPDTKKILIIDLAITCWSINEQDTAKKETIEIGAILVNTQTLGAMKEFRTFVKPIAYPELSNFCKQLTSISQKDIDSADPFPVALKNLTDFCGKSSQITLSSWGQNTRMQLFLDCARHNIAFPFGENHFNIREMFVKKQGVKKCALKKAVEIANLKFDGTFHRALDNARYIHKILQHLAQLD
jgi:inhibitor of KinA sporulation pathway (predicted exonuclease)